MRILLITSILIPFSVALAVITPDNCTEYLESGEANYSINASLGNIDWGLDTTELNAEIERFETIIKNNPDDYAALTELISLYGKAGYCDKAVTLARDNLVRARDDYKASGTEEAAVRYAKVALTADLSEEYDDAYLALQPFLESGSADEETFVTAISLRSAAADYELATRVADAYITQYPKDPEAYYQRFSVVSVGNLYGVLGYVFGQSLEYYLSSRGEASLNGANVREFIKKYIKDLAGVFDMVSAEKAAELAPDNYEYNLAVAIFKTLITYYSTMLSAAYTEGAENLNIVDIFCSADEAGITDILPYLERAEVARPKRDIQVFLAYALYYMSVGDLMKADEYAQLAIDNRPDLPEGYDAHILLNVLPIADELGESPGKAAEVFPGLIAYKISNTGGGSCDYAVMAAMEFFKYPDTPENERPKRLATMKEYADEALKRDGSNETAKLNLGNYYILTENYDEAISVFSSGYEEADTDKKVLFLNNRGVTKALKGDIEGAIADLKTGLNMSGDNERTREALAELGVE